MPISRNRTFGGFARPSGDEPTTPVTPEFITVASDLPGAIVGRPYFHQFKWIGRPDPIFEVVGYPGAQYTERGALFIPNISAPGTFPMEARLRENLGDTVGNIIDTVAWDLVATNPQQLTNAAINSTTLAAVTFGDTNPLVPLDVAGSEPYTLSLESGALPDGLGLRVGSFTRAELLVTCVEGVASLEGAGFSCGIAVTGATGVKSATKTFSNGITVNREPTFVGLTSIPQFPANTPGAFDLAPFVRSYPAITGFIAAPVLSTVHANLGQSGLTITYGDLTSIAGTQTAPILFTLDSNGIGDPDTLTSVIEVGTSSVPVPKVLAAYDFSSYSATNGTEITTVPDLAQGLALPMSTALTIAGTSGPTWNATSKCAQMRAGKSIGIALSADLYPIAIGISADFKSTTGTGNKEFLRSQGTFAYFDKGATGGARPTFLESAATTKFGTRSSDTIPYTPGSAISGLVLKIGVSSSADIISGVTVNNGGTPVALTRSASAADVTGEFLRTYIYFLGSGIPSGALTITVNYTGSTSVTAFFIHEGYTAATDIQVVNAPTPVQADAANPSIVCDTGSPARDCLATAMLGSGLGVLASITDGGSQTRQSTFTETIGPQFDALTRNNRTGNSDPTTFTHTPVGTPKGVILVAMNVNSDTDHYVAATYGGVAATPILSLPRAGASNGHLKVLYLGSGIPTGAQTVSFDWDSATTDDIELMCITLTAAGDTEVVDSDSSNQTSANPSVTMNAGGRVCAAYGFMIHGADDPATVVENANMTVVQEIGKGTASWVSHRQTTPSRDDFTFSYTAASDAHTLGVITIAEVANVGDTTFVGSRQTTGGTGDFTFSWTIASDDVALCAITMSEVQGSGALLSLANNGLYSTAPQTGVIDTKVRHILYAASATSGSYWKNGVKSALSGSGTIAGRLNNIILHGTQCDWDLYKLEIWKGVLSDGDATAMDTRLNTDRTPPTPSPPGPPTNIVASPGNAQVNLSWTPAPNAVSVKIERSTTGGGAGFSEIAAGVTTSTYQDTGRTNGQIYYYRLRSTGAGGDSAYSAEVNATPQTPSVGAPQNNRITNIASGTISHAWDAVTGASYKVYRGTAQGGPYTLIASGVTALAYQHPSLANGTPYYFVVKATISGVDSANSNEVSATPQASTGITRTFPLIDGILTADLLLSQHASDLIFEASGPGIQGRLVNSPTSGGGSNTAGHLIGGFPFMKPVTKTVPHLGVTRKFFEMTIWDSSANSFLYPSNGSIRATIAAGKYDTNVGLQEEWFYAMAFMVDDSMIQVDPILSGFDHGFLGLHNAIVSGLTLTPMSFFLDPTSAGTMQLRITIRFHPEDNAQPGETRRVEAGASIGNIRPGHYYELLYRWKLGYWNVHGGYAQAWLYEDGVARNAGKPFLDHAGRLGYNLPTPPGFKHQRRIMSHYQWRGKNQFTQVSPDNIGGIPSGAKGSRMWVRKSLCCAGGTSGGITVTKDTLLNYLRLVE